MVVARTSAPGRIPAGGRGKGDLRSGPPCVRGPPGRCLAIKRSGGAGSLYGTGTTIFFQIRCRRWEILSPPGVAPSRQKRFGIVSPAVVGDRPRAEKRAVSIDDGGLRLCGERGVWPVGLDRRVCPPTIKQHSCLASIQEEMTYEQVSGRVQHDHRPPGEATAGGIQTAHGPGSATPITRVCDTSLQPSLIHRSPLTVHFRSLDLQRPGAETGGRNHHRRGSQRPGWIGPFLHGGTPA